MCLEVASTCLVSSYLPLTATCMDLSSLLAEVQYNIEELEAFAHIAPVEEVPEDQCDLG